MNSFLLVLATASLSMLVALYLSRWLGGPIQAATQPPALRPGADPLLALVLRANQALGVWVAGPGDGPPRRAVAAGVTTADETLLVARMAHLRGQSSGGMEQLECGVMVHAVLEGWVAIALAPGPGTPAMLEALRADLGALLSWLQREPVLASVDRLHGRPHETVESIAMRLAHQLERLLDTEVGVAIARPQGVQVLGVSLRSDPRLRLALAAPGSPLDDVGRGIDPGPRVSDDPLGRSGNERRRARPRTVILPIPSSRLTVGAVVVATPDGVLPPGSVAGELFQALEAAGPRLQQALERQELYETTLSDPLTGLRNRRGLDEAMSRVTAGEGALIYADLDRFKLLNDTLGHAAGDAALVHFARICGQATRSGDVVARIGGEEFALWLPNASLAEGVEAAERVRAGLEATVWAWQGREWPLTASFGVAGCPETVPGLEHLASRADAALYRAKDAGRNRVVSSS